MRGGGFTGSSLFIVGQENSSDAPGWPCVRCADTDHLPDSRTCFYQSLGSGQGTYAACSLFLGGWEVVFLSWQQGTSRSRRSSCNTVISAVAKAPLAPCRLCRQPGHQLCSGKALSVLRACVLPGS